MAAAEKLDNLKAKLAQRETVPGYAENCAAIRAEIARLEAEIAQAAD